MTNHKNISLSSSWTIPMLYLALIVSIIMLPVFALIMMADGFHIGMVFAGLMYLVALLIIFYQFKVNCDAHIMDNKLVLKKMYRPAKSYSFDQISKLSSFRAERTQFTNLEMKNDDGQLEHYMIATYDRTIDAERILNDLKSGVV